MATYVISDIHGRREEFYAMLELIDFKKEDTLYVLGDVLDRGPHGLTLLLELAAMENVKMLVGNHEQMAIEHLRNEDFDTYEATHWIVVNGGQTTKQEWGHLTVGQKKRVIDIIDHLPNHFFVEVNGVNFCLVHAGLIPMNNFEVEELVQMQEEKLTWVREPFYQARTKFRGAVVVAGHTPTEYINPKRAGRIWQGPQKDRLCIDCGEKVLGCLRLDDLQEFYKEG